MKKTTFFGNKNIISDQLRAARKAKGLTQDELAAQMQSLGVSQLDQQAISRIERNLRAVSDYELAALCKALRQDPGFFLQNFVQILKEYL